MLLWIVLGVAAVRCFYLIAPLLSYWLRQNLVRGAVSLGSFLIGDVPVAVLRGTARGVILAGISVAAFRGATMMVDQNLSLSARQVQNLSENWALLEQAARETDTNVFVLAATWGVECSMCNEGPSNGQGIGGFYTLSNQGTSFPVGPYSSAEMLRQFRIMAQQIHAHCPGNLAIAYEGAFDASEDAMWDRAACWARYNGFSGFVRGDMRSAAAVFNNLTPQLQDLEICLADGCPTRGPMRNDGYEVYYRKVANLVFAAAAQDGRQVDGPSGNVGSMVGQAFNDALTAWRLRPTSPPSLTFSPSFGSAPTQRIVSYATLPRPEVGQWGPIVGPLGGSWTVTQGYHGMNYGAVCVDLASLESDSAPVYAPISGILTAYSDSLGNSVILIENPEWVAVLLHHRRLDAQNGSYVIAGQQIGLQGSVGNSTGPHVHYCLYNKAEESYVPVAEYVPGWPQN